MPQTYTAYDAKAKLGEILRKVRAGQRVIISYRGQDVAEVRPLVSMESIGARISSHREHGTLTGARLPGAAFKPLVRKRGALNRFLESRD